MNATPARFSLDFTGSSVLVTGVGRRGQVGESVARTFAQRGATLFIVDRNQASVNSQADDLRSLGAQTRPFACDLSDPNAVQQLSEDVRAAAPDGLHALVNLAGGFAASGSVSDSDPAIWHRQFSINLTTAYLTTRAFLPQLRLTRGTIVFFAAAAALPGSSGAHIAAYAAAKSGVLALMRAVAAEERESGVRANALAPTSIRTETNLESMGDSPKYVERETIADWVLWLSSPLSGPLTGQALKVGY